MKGIDHDGIVAIQCNFSLDCTLFIIAVYLPSTNHSIDEFNEGIENQPQWCEQHVDSKEFNKSVVIT